jgi:hypothetical protein
MMSNQDVWRSPTTLRFSKAVSIQRTEALQRTILIFSREESLWNWQGSYSRIFVINPELHRMPAYVKQLRRMGLK